MEEMIENLEARIVALEEKLKEQELNLTLGISEIATKDWVDTELSQRLRYYQEK